MSKKGGQKAAEATAPAAAATPDEPSAGKMPNILDDVRGLERPAESAPFDPNVMETSEPSVVAAVVPPAAGVAAPLPVAAVAVVAAVEAMNLAECEAEVAAIGLKPEIELGDQPLPDGTKTLGAIGTDFAAIYNDCINTRNANEARLTTAGQEKSRRQVEANNLLARRRALQMRIEKLKAAV